jgi:hypothetical protein
MTVKTTTLTPGVRDSYWRATQAELHSIQRRGEKMLMGSVAAIVLVAVFVRDRIQEAGLWVLVASAVFALFLAEVAYVVIRKRRIAAARGMVCGQCDYTPHDTELNSVAHSRKCPRCEGEL